MLCRNGNAGSATFVHPTPDLGGIYAGMWITNSPGTYKADYREGMFNRLLTTIQKNSGYYAFSFDLARLSISAASSPVEIGIYGVNNPANALGSTPTSSTLPSNLDLFGPGNTVLLGTITVPSTASNVWTSQTIIFNSSILPPSGITHILITKSDAVLPGMTKMYMGFDNFCMHITPPPQACQNCCNDVSTTVQSQVVYWGTSGGGWGVTANLTTAPNPIIEIKADLVNFYINNQPGCERCINQSIYLGSIIPNRNPQTQINWNGQLVSPTTTCSPEPKTPNKSPREFVWNNIVNGQYLPRPPLNNENINFSLVFPLPHIFQNTCCFDTIKFCIRWSFTDVNCKTCDTLICYQFTQQPQTNPCDSTLNTIFYNQQLFENSLSTSQLIDFSTKDDGSPITDPSQDLPFSSWIRSGITFMNFRSYWNLSIYTYPNTFISIILPQGVYKKVGFIMKTGYAVNGHYTIKIYSGDCHYTYVVNGLASVSYYFGINSPTPIDKIEVSHDQTYIYIDDFRFGN